MTYTRVRSLGVVVLLAMAFGTVPHAQQARGGSPAEAQRAVREAALAQYAGAWNRTTEAEIVAALKTCWTPTSTYTDPGTNTTHGPVELARAIMSFHKSLPGATLKPTSGLDTHHNVGRFSWRLTMPAPVVVNGVQQPQESDGFDFIEFSADGTKIMKIVGFFGPFPKP
jgi:hypothetical protein